MFYGGKLMYNYIKGKVTDILSNAIVLENNGIEMNVSKKKR